MTIFAIQLIRIIISNPTNLLEAEIMSVVKCITYLNTNKLRLHLTCNVNSTNLVDQTFVWSISWNQVLDEQAFNEIVAASCSG